MHWGISLGSDKKTPVKYLVSQRTDELFEGILDSLLRIENTVLDPNKNGSLKVKTTNEYFRIIKVQLQELNRCKDLEYDVRKRLIEILTKFIDLADEIKIPVCDKNNRTYQDLILKGAQLEDEIHYLKTGERKHKAA